MQKSFPGEGPGSPQTGSTVISGWLKKKAASNGAWNSRFVALKSNGTIEYNKRSREGTLLRKKQTSDMETRLQLTRSSTVTRKASGRAGLTRDGSGKNVLARKPSGRKNGSGVGAFENGRPVIRPNQETTFLISGDTHRDLCFAAASGEEANQWFEAIQATIAQIANGNRPQFESFAYTKKANIFKNVDTRENPSAPTKKIENPGWHMR
jgi:hypothetical protein